MIKNKFTPLDCKEIPLPEIVVQISSTKQEQRELEKQEEDEEAEEERLEAVN